MKMQCLAGLALLVAASVAAADTITVCLDGTCDFDDIQSAIDFANDGDAIHLSAESYYLTSTISIEKKTLSLIGSANENGHPLTVIDGQNSIRLFNCITTPDSSVSFESIRFQNGSVFNGGAACLVSEQGSATWTNCTFYMNVACNDCSSGDGGALRANYGASITVQGCSFLDNRANYSGAIYGGVGGTYIRDCYFSGNAARASAGCIGFHNSLSISNSTFVNNYAGHLYGSVAMDRGNSATLELSNSVLCDNNSDPISVYGWEDDGTNCISSKCGCDADMDGLLNTVDNCPGVANPDQNDCDLDGIGDACELDCDTDGNPDDCEIAGGEPDVNLNGIPDTCECITDIDGNGTTDGTDLSYLLAGWGSDGSLIDDLDIYKDGTIDGTDLSYLLAAWGACP